MFLGESNKKAYGVPTQQTTNFTQLSELNKKVRNLHNVLNKNICCLRDLNQIEFDQTQVILTEIRELLELSTPVGQSCDTPVYASLCELQQILDKLDEIKTSGNGGNGGDGDSTTEYNNNSAQVSTENVPIVLAANSYHSVSIVVLNATATITIDGVSFSVSQGYSNTWEASTLLANEISVVTPTSGAVIVTTIN